MNGLLTVNILSLQLILPDSANLCQCLKICLLVMWKNLFLKETNLNIKVIEYKMLLLLPHSVSFLNQTIQKVIYFKSI